MAAALAVLSIGSLTGCQHTEQAYRNIVLDGFSDRNHVELTRSLGTPVCIRGTLSIDAVHDSVYFQLEPIEDRGTITIGFSRILAGLSADDALGRGMENGESYRICGTLRDATPWRRCDHDSCRWYRLENARTALRF